MLRWIIVRGREKTRGFSGSFDFRCKFLKPIYWRFGLIWFQGSEVAALVKKSEAVTEVRASALCYNRLERTKDRRLELKLS